MVCTRGKTPLYGEISKAVDKDKNKMHKIGKPEKKRSRAKSAKIIPLSFLAAIAIGTILLWMPWSTVSGEHTSLLTALFTATTSVCVTGLVVVDTFAHWTLFGKIVILILIQLGGFGIIAVASILMLMFKRNLSLRDRVIIHDAFNMESFDDVMPFLTRVFKWTFLVEMLGALLYIPCFVPRFGTAEGIWISVFNAISAFCNAGIDIMGPDSLISYNGNVPVMFITMMLIILGGLGYVVWFDLLKGLRNSIKNHYSIKVFWKHLGEHTRLVLFLTGGLILGGMLTTFIAEFNNPGTMGEMSFGGKLLNSLFQSVTFRTAGFASVPQENLSPATCTVGYLLMFIGGSPVGTAGGVKTVTFCVVVLNAISFIRDRNETVAFGRKVTDSMARKASAIIAVSFGATLVLLWLLLATNPVSWVDGAFEMISATATVGLTRALTPTLNLFGKLLVILAMFLGRIGPISMAFFFLDENSKEKNRISFAEGKFFVG